LSWFVARRAVLLRKTNTDFGTKGSSQQNVRADGVNTNSGCCFDYGNASTNLTASGNMDAVEFSKNKFWGHGAGSGPFVLKGGDARSGTFTTMWDGARPNGYATLNKSPRSP